MNQKLEKISPFGWRYSKNTQVGSVGSPMYLEIRLTQDGVQFNYEPELTITWEELSISYRNMFKMLLEAEGLQVK